MTMIWEIEFHLHQKYYQHQALKSSEISRMTWIRPPTKKWQIKVHLHQQGHQIQIVESSGTSPMSRNKGFDKDMANQSSFTTKKLSTPNRKIKLNL